MQFLSARWRNLLLANFCVDPSVLQPFVPPGTSIDAHEGRVFVSLVAFLFENTRVLGIPALFHRRFEEVNLRFYVKPDKDPTIRAVTFIKEIVPSPVIPWIANALFSENYASHPMQHGRNGDTLWYSWGTSGQDRISATIDRELALPPAGSNGEFITEHYWGYAKGHRGTLEYHVMHPQWKCCKVDNFEISVDFARTYGERFGFLSSTPPFDVLYAEGSNVTVSFPKRL